MGKIGPGTVVGGAYLIERLLGRGGMGSVYAASRLRGGGEVALKLLDATMTSNEEALLRFKREASASTVVRHPGVVQVLDSGNDDGTPFLVMELLEGETLADRLQANGPFSAEQTVAVLTAVLEVLEVAHGAGVVHRDLKPPNIFLARKPRPAVKVLDFGISQLGGTTTRITRTGSLMGTLPYMAPEQIRDTASAGAASDLYAVGVLAYELLTGKRPFDARNDLTLMQQITTEAPPELRPLAPGTPPALVSLVEGLLKKVPGDRPGDARAVGQALRACAAPDTAGLFTGVAAPPEGALFSTTGAIDTGGFSDTRASEKRSPPEGASGRWGWVLAGLGVLAAGGAAAALAWPSAPGPSSPSPVTKLTAVPAPLPKPDAPAVPKAIELASGSEVVMAEGSGSTCGTMALSAERHLSTQLELVAIELNHCLVSDPDYAPAYFLWAKRVERLGLASGRGDYYQAFVDRAPKEHPRWAEAHEAALTSVRLNGWDGPAKDWLKKALAAFNAGDFERATKAYQACLKEEALVAPCHFGLGTIYDADVQRQLEIEHDVLALDLAPNDELAPAARKRLDARYEQLMSGLSHHSLSLPLPNQRMNEPFAWSGLRTAWDWDGLLKRCGERQLIDDPLHHRTARISFRVLDGKATDVRVTQDIGSVYSGCVVDGLKAMRFVGETKTRVDTGVSY